MRLFSDGINGVETTQIIMDSSIAFRTATSVTTLPSTISLVFAAAVHQVYTDNSNECVLCVRTASANATSIACTFSEAVLPVVDQDDFEFTSSANTTWTVACPSGYPPDTLMRITFRRQGTGTGALTLNAATVSGGFSIHSPPMRAGVFQTHDERVCLVGYDAVAVTFTALRGAELTVDGDDAVILNAGETFKIPATHTQVFVKPDDGEVGVPIVSARHATLGELRIESVTHANTTVLTSNSSAPSTTRFPTALGDVWVSDNDGRILSNDGHNAPVYSVDGSLTASIPLLVIDATAATAQTPDVSSFEAGVNGLASARSAWGSTSNDVAGRVPVAELRRLVQFDALKNGTTVDNPVINQEGAAAQVWTLSPSTWGMLCNTMHGIINFSVGNTLNIQQSPLDGFVEHSGQISGVSLNSTNLTNLPLYNVAEGETVVVRDDGSVHVYSARRAGGSLPTGSSTLLTALRTENRIVHTAFAAGAVDIASVVNAYAEGDVLLASRELVAVGNADVQDVGARTVGNNVYLWSTAPDVVVLEASTTQATAALNVGNGGTAVLGMLSQSDKASLSTAGLNITDGTVNVRAAPITTNADELVVVQGTSREPVLVSVPSGGTLRDTGGTQITLAQTLANALFGASGVSTVYIVSSSMPSATFGLRASGSNLSAQDIVNAVRGGALTVYTSLATPSTVQLGAMRVSATRTEPDNVLHVRGSGVQTFTQLQDGNELSGGIVAYDTNGDPLTGTVTPLMNVGTTDPAGVHVSSATNLDGIVLFKNTASDVGVTWAYVPAAASPSILGDAEQARVLRRNPDATNGQFAVTTTGYTLLGHGTNSALPDIVRGDATAFDLDNKRIVLLAPGTTVFATVFLWFDRPESFDVTSTVSDVPAYAVTPSGSTVDASFDGNVIPPSADNPLGFVRVPPSGSVSIPPGASVSLRLEQGNGTPQSWTNPSNTESAWTPVLYTANATQLFAGVLVNDSGHVVAYDMTPRTDSYTPLTPPEATYLLDTMSAGATFCTVRGVPRMTLLRPGVGVRGAELLWTGANGSVYYFTGSVPAFAELYLAAQSGYIPYTTGLAPLLEVASGTSPTTVAAALNNAGASIVTVDNVRSPLPFTLAALSMRTGGPASSGSTSVPRDTMLFPYTNGTSVGIVSRRTFDGSMALEPADANDLAPSVVFDAASGSFSSVNFTHTVLSGAVGQLWIVASAPDGTWSAVYLDTALCVLNSGLSSNVVTVDGVRPGSTTTISLDASDVQADVVTGRALMASAALAHQVNASAIAFDDNLPVSGDFHVDITQASGSSATLTPSSDFTNDMARFPAALDVYAFTAPLPNAANIAVAQGAGLDVQLRAVGVGPLFAHAVPVGASTIDGLYAGSGGGSGGGSTAPTSTITIPTTLQTFTVENAALLDAVAPLPGGARDRLPAVFNGDSGGDVRAYLARTFVQRNPFADVTTTADLRSRFDTQIPSGSSNYQTAGLLNLLSAVYRVPLTSAVASQVSTWSVTILWTLAAT